MSGGIEFAPCPENTFDDHIREYFERSREACPQIEAIYGKWTFEDLIPGMSDFDTRFIVSDDTSPEDWVHISREVGRVHTEICREDPNRARILEHLPGINLTWSETCDRLFYYPEFHQWTGFYGDREKMSQFASFLAEKPWSTADELFSVKKFALYFTPYNRGIDPPINLGAFESKYPLHSRFMHYFCPPVQCAVGILEKRMVRGKLDSLRLARGHFPNESVIDLIFDAVERHYEIPGYYVEPKLTEIEDALFDYLGAVYEIIRPEITVIDARPGDTSDELKKKLGALETALLDRFYEGAKFCRLMMGRLLFYAEEIPHFDSSWLIGHELRRIRRLFFETTFAAFGRIAWDENLTPEEALERCRGEFLADDEYGRVKAYADIFGEPYDESRIKEFAREVAARMAPFQVVLEKLGGTARRLAVEKGMV